MSKITRNQHQYKVNLPIRILRKLNWDDNTIINIQEVETPNGRGIIILRDEVMKI